MKKKIFIVLFLAGLFGCTKDLDVTTPVHVKDILSTDIVGSSSSSTYFPLFQLFLGKSNADCDQKISDMYRHFFNQKINNADNPDKIYYEVGNDKAYIYDTGNKDVRSEGMSYGMMITVQLNRQTEFNKLWNWAKTYMLNADNTFAWQCSTSGTKLDTNAASDGDQYFTMALYFAHNRWGSSGTYNYKASADAIASAMLSKIFVGTNSLPAFTPKNTGYTDPSYHLPLFYQLFAKYTGNTKWNDIAKASRQYLATTVSRSTYGLVPDYSNYDGTPNNGGSNHDTFRFDAWRTIMNINLDIAWNGDHYGEYGTWPGTTKVLPMEYDTRILNFFNNQGISSYLNQYKLDGTGGEGDHSPGLVAMNAVGARFLYDLRLAQNYAQQFWDTPMPSGTYRYYDGCLYMLSMLFSTGNYNVIDTDGSTIAFKLYTGNPNYAVNTFKSNWSGRVLTATGTQNDADTKAQPANSSWNSQQWQLETVPNTTYFRLKNIYSNKYLNVQNQNESAKVVCYDLHEDWTSEQWIIQTVSGNQVRLKNVWSGKYLTVQNTSDYASIFSQSLNTGWASQIWIMN